MTTNTNNEVDKFFQLMRYSCEFRKKNQFIWKEDDKSYQELTRLSVQASEKFYWEERFYFENLIDEFLQKIIDWDEFITVFMNIYSSISKKWDTLKKEIETAILEEKNLDYYYSKISDLLTKTELDTEIKDISDILLDFFITCTNVRANPDPDLSSLLNEKELYIFVQQKSKKLKKYLH